MINVCLAMDADKNKKNQKVFKFFQKENIKKFRKYGINIVNTVKECDYIFYSLNLGFNYYNKQFEYFWNNEERWGGKYEITQLQHLINKGKKLLLYYRSDSANLIPSRFIKFYLDNPDKIIFFRDFTINFEYHQGNEIMLVKDKSSYTYHNYLIKKNFSMLIDGIEYSEMKINCDDYKRINIKIFTWRFQSYGWLNQNYDLHNNISNKPIDITFIKNFRDLELNCFYRKKIRSILDKIHKYNIRTEKCHPDEYLNIIAKSKICISAWGKGECVYDDWKGIMNNTIVLKPDTKHVKDYYGIYNPSNEMIVYFKPDLSDFIEKIEHVLHNYDIYLEKVKKAKKYLVNTFTEERHIQDFCKLFTQ